MFNFGDRVVILNETLKSHNHAGVFVGLDKKGLCKVYLEEPLQSKKSIIGLVTVNKEFVFSVHDNVLKTRLDQLYARQDELERELEAIKQESYEIELKLMMGGS